MTQPPGPPPPSGSSPAEGWGGQPSPEERNWALAAHIGSLVAAWVALGFLAPLIVMLAKGDQSPFVRRHALESLNFQITLLIYLTISAVLALVLIGFLLLLLVGVFGLVMIVIATVKAANGEDFRYPLTIRLVH
jgi:uncharacterized Tic20 family protein